MQFMEIYFHSQGWYQWYPESSNSRSSVRDHPKSKKIQWSLTRIKYQKKKCLDRRFIWEVLANQQQLIELSEQESTMNSFIITQRGSMHHLHQSESQKQTKVTKMMSQQVGLCSVNTGQSPAMNTFTITYSHSISRHRLRAKAMQQTKLTKMTRKKGNNRQKISGQVGVCYQP